VWQKPKKTAGYGDRKDLCIHSLRHTYASLAIKAGCDVKTLQNVMGHTTAPETLDIYAELCPDRVEEVTHALEKDYNQWTGDKAKDA
jgi:integrase/recombinase XerD